MTDRIRGRKLQEIRRRHLAKHPLCVHCQQEGRIREAVEVDHITPLYKGGEEAEGNRQSLCSDHHKAKTRLDMGWKGMNGCGLDGVPTDPGHHWRA